MERRRIYLMRHGAVAYFDADGRPVAPDDVPLTAEGRRQAQAAGALLERTTLDRVISSDLPRAVETATIVAHMRSSGVQCFWPEIAIIAHHAHWKLGTIWISRHSPFNGSFSCR